jgi:SAM-dependent methyltransferase
MGSIGLNSQKPFELDSTSERIMPSYRSDIDEVAYLDEYGETDWSLVFKREMILKHVPVTTRRVLDCGCGAGHLAKKVWDRHIDIVALDLDLEALQRTKRRYRGPLVRASALAVPFRPESFDSVILSDLLEHIPDGHGVLSEIRRVLEPGARLIVTVPAMRCLWSQHDVRLGHIRRYEKDELCSVLRRAGFTIIKVFYWASLFFPLAFLIRKLTPGRGRSGGVMSRRQRELVLKILRMESGVRCRPFGVSLLAVVGK